MIMVNDMKRKVAKVTKRRLTVLGTLSIVAIIYFCFTLCYHAYSIYDLRKNKQDLENKYSILKEEAEDLQLEINKLNDPDYLARFAREKYSYSKEGEYIIKLNQIKSDIQEVEDNTTNNYLVIGLCGSIFLIFIYIFFRAKKKDNNV